MWAVFAIVSLASPPAISNWKDQMGLGKLSIINPHYELTLSHYGGVGEGVEVVEGTWIGYRETSG